MVSLAVSCKRKDNGNSRINNKIISEYSDISCHRNLSHVPCTSELLDIVMEIGISTYFQILNYDKITTVKYQFKVCPPVYVGTLGEKRD